MPSPRQSSLWVFSEMLCTSHNPLPFPHIEFSHFNRYLLTNTYSPSPSISYERALRHQPIEPTLYHPAPAYILLLIGNLLVLSSTYALGITGTYLGDYFGILLDAPVTSFPFNITGAPMYYGSAMSFLGTALLYGRPAGVLLSAEVLVLYSIAQSYEE